jgi:hypothetical protein
MAGNLRKPCFISGGQHQAQLCAVALGKLPRHLSANAI